MVFCTAISFLLSLAESLFLKEVYNSFFEVFGDYVEEKRLELGVLPESSEKQHLNSSENPYNTALKYPGNPLY